MICAAADDARAEPGELIIRRYGIRLARNVPIPIRRREIAPLHCSIVVAGVRARAAMRHIVGPHALLEIGLGIQHWAGFEQRDIHAQIGEDLDHRAAARTGADDDHIRDLGFGLDLKHAGS